MNYLEEVYGDDPRWAYFQPDEVKEITRHRRRSHIIYKGGRFEINLDKLLEPKHDQVLLEIKNRTWTSSDADRKAQLLTELLDVLELIERVSEAGVRGFLEKPGAAKDAFSWPTC